MSEKEKDKIKEYHRKRYQQLIQYKKEALQNKCVLFLLIIIMSVNKEELYESKQPINLNLVNVDQIVISDKFKHSDDGFKYFIGYKEGEIVKPLCINFPQMSGYIKYFENTGKNMSFMIKNDDVLDKYNEIWNKIKHKISQRDCF